MTTLLTLKNGSAELTVNATGRVFRIWWCAGFVVGAGAACGVATMHALSKLMLALIGGDA